MYFLKKFKTFTIGASNIEEIKKIKNALRFIEGNAAHSFSSVKLIRGILVRPRGNYDNMLFPEESVYICESKTIQEASKAYLASLFVHEGGAYEAVETKRKIYWERCRTKGI